MLHLNKDLKAATEALQHTQDSLVVRASCELFKRYVTRTWTDLGDFALLRQKLLERGTQFKANAQGSARRIASFAASFVRDGQLILTHGYSKVVVELLREAVRMGKRFRVLLTEGRPASDAYSSSPPFLIFPSARTARELLAADIPVSLIADSLVAHEMRAVDLVLVGAHAVAENGGVLNKIGTYQIALVAKALKKPVYVAAQSLIFTRLYPLAQEDVPQPPHALARQDLDQLPPELAALLEVPSQGVDVAKEGEGEAPPRLKVLRAALDYTPPHLLTLLFTDLGVLTPSAVSDELIKLYS